MYQCIHCIVSDASMRAGCVKHPGRIVSPPGLRRCPGPGVFGNQWIKEGSNSALEPIEYVARSIDARAIHTGRRPGAVILYLARPASADINAMRRQCAVLLFHAPLCYRQPPWLTLLHSFPLGRSLN